MKRYFLTLLILLSACLQAWSDGMFRVINAKNGLCDNSVNAVRQDPFGMIWMATSNGLCRYDGLLFYTFHHVHNDETSIINSNVNALEISNDGLWASTGDGLDYHSFFSERFQRCTVSTSNEQEKPINWRMTSIVQNAERLFASDEEGHFLVNEGRSNPTKFKYLKHKIKIVAVCRYKNGLLVGAGPEGVYLISADGKSVIGSLKRKIPTNFKTNIYYSRNANTVFVGNGIGYESAAFVIQDRTIRELNTPVPANIMSTIDYRKAVVFASDGSGMLVKEGTQQHVYTPANSNISGDAIYTLFVDKDENLWAGMYRMGVNLLPSREPWWKTYSLTNGCLTYNIATAVLPEGDRLYVGLDGGGLNILDRHTGRLIKTVSAANSGLPSNNIVSLVKDERCLYMAIYAKGMAVMPLNGGDIRTFHMPPTSDANADNTWALHDDGLGNIWIGGPDVCVFNKNNQQVSVVKGLQGISCSAISAYNGHLWIASNNKGLYVVNPRTRRIVAHYSTAENSPMRIPTNDIKYLYVGSDGIVWITSLTSGFYSLDLNKHKIVSYGTTNGLTSPVVSSMTADGDGNLWLGTFNGLFRFSPKTGLFVRFDNGTMLPSNYTFNAACFYDGMVYAGSTGGLVSFNPHETSSGVDYSRVSFVSLSLIKEGNREFPLFGSTPKSIELTHSQNFFTLKYTVPDVYSPGRVQFSCRLDGLEKGWRELADRREVAYTNVPPGHYKFLIRCTDSNGQWSKPSVLDITITPPWYSTLWARLLWAMLIIAAIGACVWFYQHEMNIKQEMRISQIEKDTQRKLNEAKMNFYTNITHELRTPVFLIAAQLEELLDSHKSVLQVPASNLQAMSRSARKLNRLVSRVIDFRKLDSGVLRLNSSNCDVAAFCRNLVDDYEELCAQKHISFSFVCPDREIPLYCDAEKLEIILSNLVSNAFKYTNEGGHVELIVADEPGRVVFSVKDNGIGIVEKMRTTIFESFFRTERAEKQSGGDGLGLSFVKSLVELHKGHINVESEVNVGSTFTFFIPKTNNMNKENAEDDSSEQAFQPVATINADDQPAEFAALKAQDSIPSEEKTLPHNPTATHSVLIIDDERDTVNLIERALYADYKVLKAYNGEEGLAVARAELPDIVICDIMMPQMDGLAFLSTMKNDRTLQHIKVIIFTAKTAEEDMLQAYDNGADAYLTKPVSLKVLRKRIDRLVAQTDNATLANSIIDTKKTYSKEEQIFLLRCREIIDDNLANLDFNVDFMADKLAMSHSSLYKKVKSITGMSLINFINDYKVYKAVQFFRQGMTNVDSVSEKCGFKDAKNFREMFRRRMQMTPKQFVQSL